MAESDAAEIGRERNEDPVGLCSGVPCSVQDVQDSDLQLCCPAQDSCPREGKGAGGDD